MGVRLLLVEDDENKRDDVHQFLVGAYPSFSIDNAGSYQSALKALMSAAYDVMLLDMTIPTFDKGDRDSPGRLRPLGGGDVLDQVARRRIAVTVIVLTAYDLLGQGKNVVPLENVVEELRARYSKVFYGAVYYSRAEGKWKGELRSLIDRIVAEGRGS